MNVSCYTTLDPNKILRVRGSCLATMVGYLLKFWEFHLLFIIGVITNVWGASIFFLGTNANKLKWNAGFKVATLLVVMFTSFVNKCVMTRLDKLLVSLQIIRESLAVFWISSCSSGGCDPSSHSI